MAGAQSTALAAMVLVTSCKGPAPPSPADLARSAAKARAAAQGSAPSALPGRPEPPKPTLLLQEFTEQLPPVLCSPARGGTCALDVVGKNQAQDITVVKRGQETLVVGWAADTEKGTVPPVVLVQLAPASAAKAEDKKAPASKATDDKKALASKAIEYKKGEKVFFAAATRITKRADVAEVQKTPAFVDSGYDLLTSFKNVPVSEYTVSIVQVTAAGQALVCDTTRRLKIE